MAKKARSRRSPRGGKARDGPDGWDEREQSACSAGALRRSDRRGGVDAEARSRRSPRGGTVGTGQQAERRSAAKTGVGAAPGPLTPAAASTDGTRGSSRRVPQEHCAVLTGGAASTRRPEVGGAPGAGKRATAPPNGEEGQKQE